MARRSIEIASFTHQNPIPAASRIGPLVVSSVISPYDPGTRDLPATIEAQLANLFHHAGEILDAADAGWDDVVRMTFFVRDLDHRAAINGPWLEHFPDPTSRPARHTQLVPAGPGPLVSCDLTAYVEP
ncbi:MAG: RidA family protein [Actinomycetota bacterium]|nr:RidA family protein [Actinomycetota bacterium]